MFEELQYAVRSLTRAKGLVTVLLVSLGLGTGANVAVGRTIYALLFQAPAGVSDPATLVSIYTSQSGGGSYGPSSYADYVRLRSTVDALASIAAVDDRTLDNIGFDEATSQGRVAAVSDSFFSVLGMRPHIGRLLTEGDALQQPRPAVLSFARWQASGAGDDVLNRTLTVGAGEYVVVGVAPRGFRGLQAERTADVWIPLVPLGDASQRHRILSLLARLEPGARLEDAAREVGAMAVWRTDPGVATVEPGVAGERPLRISVVPYARLDPESRRKSLFVGAVVAGTVALLLASACVNAVNLLLARAVARRAEAAVMLALGASRARLVYRTLAESIIVALAAAGLGLWFASSMTAVVPLLFAADHAELVDTPFDLPLMMLALSASAVAGALIGIAPALQGMRVPAASALRGDAGGISTRRGGMAVRATLVSCQIALSIVLLVMTGVLGRSLDNALSGDLGFLARQVAVVAVQSPGGQHTPSRGMAFQEAVLDSFRRVEGIGSASWASTPPLSAGSRRQFIIETDAGAAMEAAEFDVNVVSPSYFATLRLALVEGRVFTDEDRRRRSPVVVVDDRLAARYLNGRASGRYLRDAVGTRYEVLGTVLSGKYRTLQESPRPTIYVPHTQEYAHRTYLFVRTAGDPSAMLDSIGARISAVDGGASIVRAFTLQDHMSQALALDRLTTSLVGVCGLIALALSCIGVYGVVSDAVQRRTREIGLRVALGAGGPRVATLVFVDALYPTSAGLALGFYALFLIGRVVRSFVYGVPAPDVVTLAAASAILVAMVAAAAVPPLRRALRVSPAVALRAQ